jgi:hypothetical protein
MTHPYVTREEWDAREPDSEELLIIGNVEFFIVHYTGASRSQTIKSLQDYSMDVRNARDILYNSAVKDGVEYEGRHHNEGGHIGGLNEESYGVVVFGLDGDATEADMRTIEEIYDRECKFFGKRLIPYGHGEAPGQNTSCPGSQLQHFVNTRLKNRDPFNPKGNDMDDNDKAVAWATTNRADALMSGEDAWFTIAGEPLRHTHPTHENPDGTPVIYSRREPNNLKAQLDRIEAKQAPAIDLDELARLIAGNLNMSNLARLVANNLRSLTFTADE